MGGDGAAQPIHKVLMGGMGGGGGSMILSTLLHELDGSMEGFLLDKLRARVYGWLGLKMPEPDSHVFTFGSTNIPHVLDPALVRSGRLSRRLEVGLPDRSGTQEILRGYIKKVPCAPDVSVDRLVSELSHATPADIKSLVLEEAPRKAVFEDRDVVEMRDFVAALREVRAGLRNPIQDLDPKEREAIAVHEAGHATLDWVLTDHRVATVTIVRYGDALGHVLPLEMKTRAVYKLNEMWRDVIISVGGRAAEIMVYGEPMKSVGGDYPHAMRTIRGLLQSGLWGAPMEPVSPFGMNEGANSKRIGVLFDLALEEAGRVLNEYKVMHWKLVEELLARDELTHEDVEKLIGGDRPRVDVRNPVEPERARRDKDEDRD